MDESLIDMSIIATARERYDAASRRAEEAVTKAQEAEARLPEAVKAREALVAKAAAGESVGAAELRKAEDAARDAESAVVFARDVAARLAAEKEKVHDAFMQSHSDAVAPLARDGASRLLAAASRRDKAMAMVKAAEADMQDAVLTIHTAHARGFKVVGVVGATKPGNTLHVEPTPEYLTRAEVLCNLASAGLPVDDLAA